MRTRSTMKFRCIALSAAAGSTARVSLLASTMSEAATASASRHDGGVFLLNAPPMPVQSATMVPRISFGLGGPARGSQPDYAVPFDYRVRNGAGCPENCSAVYSPGGELPDVRRVPHRDHRCRQEFDRTRPV